MLTVPVGGGLDAAQLGVDIQPRSRAARGDADVGAANLALGDQAGVGRFGLADQRLGGADQWREDNLGHATSPQLIKPVQNGYVISKLEPSNPYESVHP